MSETSGFQAGFVSGLPIAPPRRAIIKNMTAANDDSEWYGGKMSYEQRLRVRGVSEVKHAPELKLSGDEHIEQAFELIEQAIAPVGGSATKDGRQATTADSTAIIAAG